MLKMMRTGGHGNGINSVTKEKEIAHLEESR